MKVAVCFNRAPSQSVKGAQADLISEQGAEKEAIEVRQALEKRGYAARLVPLGPDLATFISEMQHLAPAVAFNLCEGFWGESGQEMNVASLFELMRIPYTGATPLCLGLTQDKARTKDLLVRYHLPTPKYTVAKPGQHVLRTHDMAFPLIVKPRAEDASLGITADSVVTSDKALRERVHFIHDMYRQEALVEEFIEGRELNVAVLGDKRFEVLPISEIVFEQGLVRPIVSYDGKWLETSEEFERTRPVCPASLRSKEDMLIRDVALRACKILECRDYARVDIRLRDGVPYILEVNANPDISQDAGLARAARAGGLTYPALIERILDMAKQRKETPHA
jgi:D-alanine-D-alanine ligase